MMRVLFASAIVAIATAVPSPQFWSMPYAMAPMATIPSGDLQAAAINARTFIQDQNQFAVDQARLASDLSRNAAESMMFAKELKNLEAGTPKMMMVEDPKMMMPQMIMTKMMMPTTMMTKMEEPKMMMTKMISNMEEPKIMMPKMMMPKPMMPTMEESKMMMTKMMSKMEEPKMMPSMKTMPDMMAEKPQFTLKVASPWMTPMASFPAPMAFYV